MKTAGRKSKFSAERWLLTSAIAIFPLYVFPSGGIQPSHLIFLVFAVWTIIQRRPPNENWLTLFLLMTFYVFLIEGVTGSRDGSATYLISGAFFLFNSLLMASVYVFVVRNGVAPLRTGVMVSAIIAFSSVVLNGVDLVEMGSRGRETGTFNNPNQLGYFSVCILSLSYLFYIEKMVRFRTLLALIAASVFLAIVSLSKAAIIANFAVLAFATRPRGRILATLTWLGSVAFIGVLVAQLTASGRLQQFVFFRRLAGMAGENDSSLVERGYFAFLDASPLEIIFGLGSARVVQIVGHEVHSTFAGIWNTYGIVGFTILMPVFLIWCRTIYKSYGWQSAVAIVGPSLLYGITHNGIRFSIFWLLVAASIGAARRSALIAAPRATRNYVGRRRGSEMSPRRFG